MASVEQQVVRAVASAVEDLAPAQVSLGKSRVVGGNFNRTTQTWKTDEVFNAESTHDDRWLDAMLHVLHFERTGDHRDLLWYHFSAHPVCFADELAGPDFPGMVNELMQGNHNLSPAYLQGHAGDVNPGDGSPWRGDADETTSAVYKAITQALEEAQRIDVDSLVSHRSVRRRSSSRSPLGGLGNILEYSCPPRAEMATRLGPGSDEPGRPTIKRHRDNWSDRSLV